MTIINRYILILTAALTVCNSLFSQGIATTADTLNRKNFSEEIYVNTDRDVYITGEQVLLKAFKFDRLTSLPSGESKIIYLEFLNNSGNILKQLKISYEGFSGSASFRIDDTLSTGNYLIRAYTSWMQNYPEETFFYKYLSVINPFRDYNKLVPEKAKSGADTLEFYPEGGSLITGINTKIAIRSTLFNGKANATEGVITDNKGTIICHFSTDKSGFGIISLTPGNEQLYASFKKSDRTTGRQQMPAVLSSGIFLACSNQKSVIAVRIRRSPGYSNGPMAKLIVVSGRMISLVREIDIQHDTLTRIIPGMIPKGAARILLYDYSGKLLSSRWIMNSEDSRAGITISTPQEKLSTRQRVDLGITSETSGGLPVEAILSVSVVRTALLDTTRMNILTRWENAAVPGEWLSGLNSDDINEHLILRSDTVGIGEIFNMAAKKPEHLPELGGQLVSGVLKSRQNHEPLKSTDISLAFVGKSALCQFQKTNSKGEFNFVVNRPGLNEIVIQPLQKIEGGYYVEFYQPFCTYFSDHQPPAFSVDSNLVGELNKAVIAMQVSKIYEPFRPQKELSAGKEGMDFFGQPDNSVRLADFIELTTVKEVLKEIIPDIMVTRRNKEYVIKLLNTRALGSSIFEGDPLILVDGVPFYNIGKLLEVNARDVERVDVLNIRYYYTDYYFDGILSFITKKGNLSAIEFDNSVFRQVFEGTQLPGKFYSPDYSVNADTLKRIADFRNTLYWNPDVQTDKKGKASLTFYTSDEPGHYSIIVEGITRDGIICRTVKPLDVY